MGGLAAANEAYRSAATPNVIIIEHGSSGDELIAGLDRLSEACDAGTKVLVVGRFNDIVLYRELVRRGISDYIIPPVTPIDVVRSMSGLFSAPNAEPVGRVIAVTGAKGGVGASSVAHNLAFVIARNFDLAVGRGGHGSAVRHRWTRLQSRSAARHRRRGVFAGPRRQRIRRPAALQVHGSPEPARGAGDARSRIRLRRRGVRAGARRVAERRCPSSCSTCRTCGRRGPSGH